VLRALLSSSVTDGGYAGCRRSNPGLTLQKTLSGTTRTSGMVSRRRTLQLAAAALAGSAGCLDSPPEGSPTPTRTRGRSPTTDDPGTPETPDGDSTPTAMDLPEWTPEWTRSFGGRNVLGLDVADGLLYATVSSEAGPSTVAAVDPAERSVLWRTDAEGEAVGLRYAVHARGGWGVTTAADAVYHVAGPAEDSEWSAVHALDRESGSRRWSLQRERTLAVAGVLEDAVVATAEEFFPAPGETAHSHATPEEPLSTVVYGLAPGDGSVLWTRELFGVVDVAVAPGGVYVAHEDGLVGLDAAGETRFTYSRGPPTQVEATAGRVFYLTGAEETGTLHGVAPTGGADWRLDVPIDELLLADGQLYAGGDAVVAVDADGTVAWRDDAYGGWLMTDPDGDTLYTRAGGMADRATAYDAATGGERFTFAPPSNNAWPEAATADALAATAITPWKGPFNTVYAVDGSGEATAAMTRDGLFEAVGLDGRIYLAADDPGLTALEP
jgi:hypothetical protein